MKNVLYVISGHVYIYFSNKLFMFVRGSSALLGLLLRPAGDWRVDQAKIDYTGHENRAF